jgi:hypothetical protein
MSCQDIVIATPHRAAIHEAPVPAAAMTSPYLNHVRSTRKIIEELILAREIELAKTTSAEHRQRAEQDLSFLRGERARTGSQDCSGWER